MTLEDHVAALRLTADRLARLGENLLLPVESCDLAGGLVALRAVLGPDTYLPISMDLTSRHADEPVEVIWKIWDGTRHHVGSTLAAAVTACLAGRKPKADPVREATVTLAGEGAVLVAEGNAPLPF